MNARSRLPDLLNLTCHTPLDYDSEVHGPVEQHYKPWGFEIYRTSYHPLATTDTQWATLCAKIVEQVHAGIDSFAEPGDEQIAARLKNSFFLNQHSDPGLQNKSVAELRVMYLRDARARGEAPEGQLFPDDEELVYNTFPGPGLFLLADAEVLEGVTKDAYFWVKAVIPDFDEENERDPELEPSMWVSPDGWFPMTTHSIVDLCMDLPHYQQMELPPRTSQKWNVYNGELTGLDPADSMCSGK